MYRLDDKQCTNILERITDAFFALDNEWRFTYLNAEAERVLLRRREELIGQNVWEKFPEAVDTTIHPNYLRAMSEQETVIFEEFYPPLDKWFEIQAYPSPEGLSVFFRDITERKRDQQELQRYRLISQYARDIVIVVRELDGRIVEANQAALDTYGFSRDELLSMTIWDLRAQDTRAATSAQMSQAGTEGILFETCHRRKDGSILPVEVSSTGAEVGGERVLISIIRDITRRKESERELTERTELLRTVIESSGAAIYTKDMEGRHTLVNHVLEQMLGMTEEELLGKTVGDLFPEDMAEILSRNDREILESGIQQGFEETVIVDDEERVFYSVKTPLRDAGGVIYGLMGVSTDITERVRIERELTESWELLQSIVDNMPSAVYVKDLDGRLLLVNKTLADLFGISVYDMLGKTSYDFYPKETADDHTANDREVLESGEPRQFEEIVPEDGGDRTFLTAKFPLLDTQGSIYGIGGVSTEITERVRAEEERAELANRISLLLESTDQGIYGLDLDGRCNLINRAAAEMTGWEPEEALGERMHDLIHHSLRDGSPYALEECPIYIALRTGEGARVEDDVFWRRDGTPFPVEYSAYPTYDGEKITGAVVTFFDITERKRTEEALSDSEERLRLATEAANIGIWDLDLITDVAARSLLHDQIWGYTEMQAEWGLDIAMQNVVPEDRPLIMEAYERAKETGLLSHENRIIWPDGNIHWISAFGRFRYDSTGRPVRVVGIVQDITERKRAEEALRESEERFRALSEAAFEGIGITREGIMLEVNQTLAEMTGYEHAELIGKSLLDLVEPEYHDITCQHALSGLKEPYEVVIRRKDGSTFIAEARGRALVYKGEPARVGALTDITERKRAEEALARQTELLQTIIDNIPVYLVIWDGQLQRFLFNQAFRRELGWTEEDAAEGDFMAMVYPDPEYRKEVEEYMRSLSPGFRDIRTTAKDGREVDVAWANVELSENRSIGIGVNVTERKRAETALRESEERFRNLADNISQLAWMADSTGRIFWYNKRWYDYTGATLEEMQGSGWQKVHHPDHIERVVEKIKHHFETGEYWEDTFPLRDKDGRYRWFISQAVPIRDEQGKVVRWFGTNTDITEIQELRRDLERALRQSERDRRRISALESISQVGIIVRDFQEMLNVLAVRIAESLDSHSCTIYLIDEQSGELEARAAHNIPETCGYRIPADKGFPGKILSTGRTVYVRDAEHDPLVINPHIKRAKTKSLLGTPLIGLSGVLGVVYINMEEIREFTNDEVRLLELMAGRAGLVIDNALLYQQVVRSRKEIQEVLERELHFSRLLQRALLPEKPEIGHGYDVADVYIPAFAEREIGGDFYDVFSTEAGKVGILIGDVSGKGLEAAALASATRNTVRAFAYDTSSAAEALTHANAVLVAQQRRDTGGAFVTVFLALLDLPSGKICYASGGHPPAIIHHVDGATDLLTFGQPPLAIMPDLEYKEATARLNPGDKLVLYTDGLSEARQGLELFGTERIEEALKQHAGESASMIKDCLLEIAREWTGGRLSDDTAIVVVERTDSEPESE